MYAYASYADALKVWPSSLSLKLFEKTGSKLNPSRGGGVLLLIRDIRTRIRMCGTQQQQQCVIHIKPFSFTYPWTYLVDYKR